MKKKKIILIIAIVLIMIASLFTVNHFIVHKNMPNGVKIVLKNTDIDVFSDIKIKDLIESTNVKISNELDFLETSSIGKKEIKILYKYKGLKYVYTTVINVVDKELPIILSGTYKTVLVGKDHDFCKSAAYGDNFDRSPKCELIGEYDINKVGTYKLTLKVTDNSKNVTEKTATLNVIKEFSTNKPSDETPKVEFSDVVNTHKNESTEIGIDVSKWQGDSIDFNKVRDAGCSFVMLRLGVQSGASKDISVDQYFEENYKKATSSGLKVGVYVYSTAIKKETAIDHANWALKELKDRELDLPIVYDWENWAYWNEYKMNFNDINEIADSFIETINKSKYKGMLYSSKYYLEIIWKNKNNYPVWLAHYTSNTSYKGDYDMWQLTNIGHIDGIKGDVDINIMYKNK